MNIDVTISIHALLAESDNAPAVLQRIFAISIHALLAESDQCRTRCAARSSVFLSTLSLRRATFFDTVQIVVIVVFLSTLSLRRATEKALQCAGTPAFLSTLSLRRATAKSRQTLCRIPISIHALLAESDQYQ